MTDTAPLVRKLEAVIPAAGATTAQDQVLGEAPFAATVSGVSFTPDANITGHDTNYRTFALVNKGSDGNGTTTVASLAFVAAVSATDYNESALTLSSTAADLEVEEGDILAWVETYAASGLASPGGLAQVELTRS